MTQVVGTSKGGIDALVAGNASSTKTVVPFELAKGCTLLANTDYYFPVFGDTDAGLNHVTLKWDAAIVVTWSVECTSIPQSKSMSGDDDLKAWDNTAGSGWNQEPLTSSSASVTDTTGATGGATFSSNTIVVAGGTAGCGSIHIGNLGSRRCRIKAHVGATGGVARVTTHAKD